MKILGTMADVWWWAVGRNWLVMGVSKCVEDADEDEARQKGRRKGGMTRTLIESWVEI